MPAPASLPIRRNTGLLAAALATNSAMLQLSAAVASLTLVTVLDIEGLLGLGPAIVLAAGALVALPAGRAMDRYGRVPVLAAGFAAGVVGCALAALGSAQASTAAVLAGLLGVGAASATALLARTAAGDMYPPERRARGIGLVLFGAVFGAILGPAVFSPLLAGRELGGDALGRLWLAGGGFMVVGLALVLAVRPDPRRIAALLARDDGTAEDEAEPAPLRELLGRPGVIPALLAAQASFGVMVGIMTLTGAVVVDHHHHGADSVFPIIGAHVVGMYALVIVIGDLIDRIGRTPALGGGLLLMALSVISLLWVTSVGATAIALVRARRGLEPVVRGGHGRAGRLHAAVGARQAAGLQRPALRADRRLAGAARRRGADRPRRGRARPGRDGAGRRPRALDPAQRAPGAGRAGAMRGARADRAHAAHARLTAAGAAHRGRRGWSRLPSVTIR